MLVVLDSTVLIDYLRGRPAVQRLQRLLERGDVPATTVINVEEIVRGLRPAETAAATALFEGLEIVPVVASDGWRAGAWRRDFAAKGVTLWQSDCLIGAVSMRIGARLATGNPKDFPMEPVPLETWPVGE